MGKSRGSLASERQAAVRQRIVDAAAEVAVDPALDSFTFDAVAERAGVARRTIFHYFPTRNDLLAAATDRAVEQFIAAAPPPPADSLEEWIESLVEFFSARNDIRAGWYFDFLLGTHDGPLREALERRQRSREHFIGRIVADAWRHSGHDGEPPRDVQRGFSIWLGTFAHAALRVEVGLDIAGIRGEVKSQLLRLLRAPHPPANDKESALHSKAGKRSPTENARPRGSRSIV